ncbi:class I SAM-dependent methyltransferase [Caldibacillus lycopersici]|uniref:Class I SAM-dependent methyltransferase n=1 Tax=Perspicuibacillus lycopersici TaxID=1325689 RepID=A0AAE3IX85_9BACI|nr:class I SAM-dependent methyltransferase [Perspicuibacillus lycopersici]MCU9614579.1 class I SAM-dependent methyltransferase [Perspicuibacillus lycopersici]
MIVTTAGRATSELVTKAKVVAEKYHLVYRVRNGVSVDAMKQQYHDDIVVVGKEQLFIAPKNSDKKLFFHPNMAMVRAKRIFNGNTDPLIEAARLKEGMSFLDCTLGLASDSIMASLAVGESGTVCGIEGNPLLFLLVTEGLTTCVSGNQYLDQAMRKIKTVNGDHFSYLLQAETNSFDVVYLDPMFHSTIPTSNGIQSIRGEALFTDVTTELIAEAKRVARKRVILKDHWTSTRFATLGFQQLKRKSSLFHYGVIEVKV